MDVQLVVFDMAGTTVHDADAVHTCLQEAMLDTAGVRMSRANCNAVMGIPKRVAITTLLRDASAEGTDPDPALVSEILEAFEERMIRYYRTSPDVREIDGASDVFRQLRFRGIRVALDTGFSRRIVDTILTRLGWAEGPAEEGGLLDATVASDEVAAGRPAPYMIYRAMERTGVTNVRKVVKVGDTPSDLNQGTNAQCGMTVGVTEGSHTRGELETHPHTMLIGSVRDLPCLLFGSASTPDEGRIGERDGSPHPGRDLTESLR